ncbi:hypothetical protein LD13_gp050 [Bacillus phage Bobb]|uniref:Uncharacterized protein n=1 Tax=Bacillus phage Bobb TaxID=1527469 RepID=A0A076G772_9CAUD|nr:hypothetical protein LD13_gp050 [Bacillus phage Bobb]AII27951.1 hypothetical protein [Bacillus phage Bobb]
MSTQGYNEGRLKKGEIYMLGNFDHLEKRSLSGVYLSETIDVCGYGLAYEDHNYSLQYAVHVPQQDEEGCVELHLTREGVIQMRHVFYRDDLQFVENLVLTLTQALWSTEYKYDSIQQFNRNVKKRAEGVYQSVTNIFAEATHFHYIFIDQEGEQEVQLCLSEFPRAGRCTSSMFITLDEHEGSKTSFFLRMLEDLRAVTRTSAEVMRRVVFTTPEEERNAFSLQEFVAWNQESTLTPIILYVPAEAVVEETKTGRLKIVGNPTTLKLCDVRERTD